MRVESNVPVLQSTHRTVKSILRVSGRRLCSGLRILAIAFRLFGLCLVIMSIGLGFVYAWPDGMSLEEYFEYIEVGPGSETDLLITVLQWRGLWAFAVVGGLIMALSWLVDGIKTLVEALTPRGGNIELEEATGS